MVANRSLGLVCVAVCLLAAPMMASADWYSDYSWVKNLTINNAASSQNLADFPVMVYLNNSNFDFSKARADGSDIYFGQAGTKLNFEIERWDSAAQKAWVWVKVPSISALSTTEKIQMYYGSASPLALPPVEQTWDSNYHMVQHLKETTYTPGTGAGNFDHFDSTSYNNDGDWIPPLYPATNPGAQGVQGKIATCDRFWGYDDWGTTPPPYDDPNRVDVPGSASLHGNPSVTVEAWCYREQATTWEDHVVRTEGEWMLNYDGSVRFGRIGTGWGAPYVVTSSFLPSMNDWHYLVGTSEYDGTNTILRIYIDGQLAGTTGPAGVAGTLSYAAASAAIRIGARSDLIGDSFFHGLIDEVRYSATTRSADWIKAQYLSMNDQFLTFGTEGAVPEPASVLLLLGGLGLLARRRAASRKGG